MKLDEEEKKKKKKNNGAVCNWYRSSHADSLISRLVDYRIQIVASIYVITCQLI